MAMESVRPAAAGPLLEKTRLESSQGKGSDGFAPGGWGKSLMVEFDVSSLVRTRRIMSTARG